MPHPHPHPRQKREQNSVKSSIHGVENNITKGPKIAPFTMYNSSLKCMETYSFVFPYSYLQTRISP